MSFTIDLTFLLNYLGGMPPSIREGLGALLIFIVLVMMIPGVIAYLIFVIVGVSGFKRLFSYERRDSPIHRMHPLPKILYVFAVSYISTIVDSYEALIILFLLTIIPWLYANPSRDKIRLVIIMLLIQFIMTAWSQSFLSRTYTREGYTWIYAMPPSLWWMSRSISLEGALEGMKQSFRIMASLSAALLLVTTTHPSDIVYGLRALKFPYEIVFMVSITIKSIPSLLEKMFLVIAAERARALSFIPPMSSNPLKIFKAIGHAMKALIIAFIPAIIEAIREARRMSLAAHVKAFRAYPKRTEYLTMELTTKDIIILILLIASMIILFINQVMGIFPI